MFEIKLGRTATGIPVQETHAFAIRTQDDADQKYFSRDLGQEI